MILNASSKTGKIPNLEEIRNYSIFRWDCSTNFDLFLIIIFVTAFIATFSRTLPDFFIYVSEAIIIVESGMLLGFFNFIQILTTATPTDKELEVAIAGMKAWYEHEYECETDKHECETENEEEKK